MSMISKLLFLALVLLAQRQVIPQVVSQVHPSPTQTSKKQSVANPPSQPHADEGERVFEQQCSRCHNTPEGFSPHISATIVRHMRVRASISKHDEEELLHFFNP
jgi:cytochrome c5